jgi:hypothetical protein
MLGSVGTMLSIGLENKLPSTSIVPVLLLLIFRITHSRKWFILLFYLYSLKGSEYLWRDFYICRFLKNVYIEIFNIFLVYTVYILVLTKDYKGVYRIASKIKDEGFEADLYKKPWCTCTLCTVQYKHTSWKECCKVLASAANFSRVK